MGNNVEQFFAEDIKPVLFKIKPSLNIDGIGVFALRYLKKGTILCDVDEVDEIFVSWEDFEKIDPITQQVMVDFCAQDKDGFYGLINLNYMSIPMHMNHHCDGNVGCDEEGDFITIRDVREGEELCFDYALVMSNPNYRLECKCGDKNCRKIITGNDWMDKSFIAKNYQYMAPLQRELVDEMFM